MRSFPAWFEDDATNPSALILKLFFRATNEVLEFEVGWVFSARILGFFSFFGEGNRGWQCPDPPGAAHVGRTWLIQQDKPSQTPLITTKSEIQGFP